MNTETKEYIVRKTKELIAAPSVYTGLKDAAQAWLDALGTPQEAAQTQQYAAQLEADITSIDGLIAFAQSPAGAQVFGGAAGAEKVAAEARKRKEEGAVYCFCDACTAVAAILERKEDMLA